MRRFSLVLAAAAVIFAGGCSETKRLLISETTAAMNTYPKKERAAITEEDINNLPAPLKKYLRYVGVVGKPKAQFVKLRQSGLFKTDIKSDWKKMEAVEYYLIDGKEFFWHGKVEMAPFINAEARDKYENGKGEMLVKLEPFITVVDFKGEEGNISELIRYFNELVWMPTAMVDSAIKWEEVDKNTVRGTITDRGMTTSALFYFNETGEIINFESDDRYAYIDGKGIKAKWVTPCRNYKEFQGIKIPTEGVAIYKLESGDFEYARLKIEDIVYDDYKLY